MPKTSSLRVPSYRRHKPTGQAVVTINGQGPVPREVELRGQQG